jgi:hypothetical protein
MNAPRLRHTAATEMLRAGASLTEVGQVCATPSTDLGNVSVRVPALHPTL